MIRIGVDGRTLTTEKPGGIGVYLREVISRFPHLWPEARLVIYSHAPIAYTGDGQNIENIVLPGKFASLRFHVFLSKRLEKDNIDLFWAPAHLLPRKSKVPYAVTIHDLTSMVNIKWMNNKREATVERFLASRAINVADTILADSQTTASDIAVFFPEASAQIRVIYLGGAEPNDIEGLDESEVLSRLGIDGKYFLYVGDLNLRKNVDTILKAFCKVADKTESKLVLAGGNARKSYERFFDLITPNTREQIICPGYVSDREKTILYRNAAAFLFPSRYEGFGIPIVEAMSAGGVVITSRTSCLEEVAGDAAIYIDDVDDSDELARAMVNVLQLSQSDRKRLISLGVKQSSSFSWETCATQTIECLKELVR